jgi:hypothetical protein
MEDKHLADVTIKGAGMLEALRRRLAAEMPALARKAVRLGVREAIERTRKKGLSIAKKRYAYSGYGRRKVDALIAERGYGPDKALNEIRFKGEPGVPLRYFQTKPGRPNDGKPLPRLKDTIRVRVLRGGSMKPLYGAGGAKVFWWRNKQGKPLLMYRAGRKLSKPDRMGASPIQALQKQDNFQTVGEYLAETMEKRIRHQLDRLGK